MAHKVNIIYYINGHNENALRIICILIVNYIYTYRYIYRAILRICEAQRKNNHEAWCENSCEAYFTFLFTSVFKIPAILIFILINTKLTKYTEELSSFR